MLKPGNDHPHRLGFLSLQARKTCYLAAGQGTTALANLDITVDKGEIFCLPGQNGAGKTTTIHLFLGFTEATGGKATINGVEVRPGWPWFPSLAAS